MASGTGKIPKNIHFFTQILENILENNIIISQLLSVVFISIKFQKKSVPDILVGPRCLMI